MKKIMKTLDNWCDLTELLPQPLRFIIQTCVALVVMFCHAIPAIIIVGIFFYAIS